MILIVGASGKLGAGAPVGHYRRAERCGRFLVSQKSV